MGVNTANLNCTQCGTTFDPDHVDIPLGDPLEGVCESCLEHDESLQKRAYTAVVHLLVRKARGIPAADIEDAVMVLELFTSLRNQDSKALAEKIRAWGVQS